MTQTDVVELLTDATNDLAWEAKELRTEVKSLREVVQDLVSLLRENAGYWLPTLGGTELMGGEACWWPRTS